MKCRRRIVFILVWLLFFNLSLARAQESKYDFKFGAEGIIEGILIDDFETAEIDATKTWHSGTVEMLEGVIHLKGTNLADTYGVDIPKANIDKKYQEALYLGFRLVNLSDGDVYFSIQGNTKDGQTYYMSGEVEKDYYLIDDEGFSHEIIFVDGLGSFNKHSLILPEDFCGYILIPTEAIVVDSDWTKTIWDDEIELKTVGMHVTSLGSPAVFVTSIHVEVDDFFNVNNPIPTYVEPTPEPTPEPTDTPEVTSTPKVTPTIEIKDDDEKKGINPLFIVLPIVGVLAIVIIVIVLMKKNRK